LVEFVRSRGLGGSKTDPLKGVVMPNQKKRLKKDGTNKTKKVQAMRAKESAAKSERPRSATGKGPQTSKRDTVKDRRGAMNRA